MFSEAKYDGNGNLNWRYKTCKAPVKSPPPTNQHPRSYRPDAVPVAQPTVSKHWRKISHSMDFVYPKLSGFFQLCLWPLVAPYYLGRGLSCLSSALWCQYPKRSPWNVTFSLQCFNSVKELKEKYHIPWTLFTPSSVGSPNLSLTTNSSLLPWEGCHALHQPSDASAPTFLHRLRLQNVMGVTYSNTQSLTPIPKRNRSNIFCTCCSLEADIWSV